MLPSSGTIRYYNELPTVNKRQDVNFLLSYQTFSEINSNKFNP